MKILIDIGHPGHVHLFKNLYTELTRNGHIVYVFTQDIKIAKALLNAYNIPYTILGRKQKSLLKKGLSILHRTLVFIKHIIYKKIDLCISSTPSLMQAAWITKRPSIFMDDDDDPVEPLICKTAHPFASVIFSPLNTIRANKKNIYYHGYHELAYLHKSRFTPNPKVLEKLNIKANERFFILRFVALQGHHDVGKKGISFDQKRKLINLLEKFGKVFITSEKNIEEELNKYIISIPPEDIHSALYYAYLFIGDSQTMTSEAALLGTAALRCNSFTDKITYLEEEEKKYDLTYGFYPEKFDELINKAHELLKTDNLKNVWENKLNKVYDDKIDVTSFLKWFIENYPKSKNIIKDNPNYQYNFK